MCLLVVALVGCGGGGGGSSSSGGGSTTQTAFFVTDAVGNYDHVWVTIKKVEVLGGTNRAVIYDDAVGKVVDLVSLNQGGTQLFSLLGVGVLPAGNYSSVSITLSSDLVLFPKGSSTGQNRQFEGSTSGVKVLSYALEAGDRRSLVADFDVSKWVDDGTFVRAVVVSGKSSSVRHDTQVEQELEGKIANLSGTSPTFSFDIVKKSVTIHVTTDASTALSNADGTANPTLANGAEVRVGGTIDATTHSVRATSVTIQGQEDLGSSEVKGTVASTGTDTFTMSVGRCDGFVPGATTITVNTSATTIFMSDSGVTLTHDDFYAALAAGSVAEAEGTYDPTTQTLTATKVKVEDESEGESSSHHARAQVQGTVSNIDATAKTFSLTVAEWEGTQLTAGTVLSVVVTDTTVLRNVDLATLTAGSTLEVRGTLSGATLTATKIKSEGESGGNGGGNGGGHDGGEHGG